jgi:hypothetical protein
MSLTATALLLSTLASAGDAVLLKDNQHGFNQRWFSRIEGGKLQVKDRADPDAPCGQPRAPDGSGAPHGHLQR